MPVSVVSVSDGSRTTVADLIGNPYVIPTKVIELLRNQFLGETLLRDAGRNANGLVSYRDSDPLYLGADVEVVAEFGEIPVAAGQIGTPRISVATKKGLGIRVSREMRDENRVDDVNRQIIQLTNTFIRANDKALRVLLTDPSIPTIAATAAWTGVGAKPRRDIANAIETVTSATPTVAAEEDLFGFEPDTVVFPGNIVPVLMDQQDFLEVYKTVSEEEDLRYTGKLPKQVLSLDALKSRYWPKDRVLVCQRGLMGFYSDTRPLEATGLYGEGGGPNGGPTESWRSDVTHKRAMGVDQPKAACWITGVQAA